ncbi:MAG TPA: endo-1,4-beta-xylanase, partial [bacterium]
ALKVVVNAVGSNTWDVQVVADSIPVVPGETYRYSIWAKSEKAGAQVNFTVGNYSYNEYGAIRPANLDTAWQEFTFEFKITDQRNFARAPIHFSIAKDIGNTIYIDNLRIVNAKQVVASQKPIVVEAESGEVGSDFAVKSEGAVTYIQIQSNGTDFTPAIWNYPGFKRRVATYQVTFPIGGTYNLFARIRVGPNGYDDDSFFYASGFGMKDTVNADSWTAVNMLAASGFSDPSHIVDGPGGLAEGVWKWINLSRNAYYEVPTVFSVKDDSLTVVFQIGGRETGFDIDKFAFGRADLYYTVGNLENGEAGSETLPGEVWEGPPLAQGKAKFLGCVYSTVQAPNFKSYWNQVTPENAGKWGSVEATRDVMNWGALDDAYNFAKSNGFVFRFHILVWGNQQPAWIEALADSPAVQLAEIREWFEAVAARYPKIDYLEVVNEPLHDPPDGVGDGRYINALGGTGKTGWDWVVNAFKMAREIFPATTKLVINEFNVTNNLSNVTQYLQIVRLLQKDNLIDGIGFQAYASMTRNSSASIKQCLDSLATAGLPLQITEMDIDGLTDDAQVADYQRIFPIFWEHPALIGITLWGWRPPMWRNEYKPHLVEVNGKERPALEWLRGYVQTTSVSDEKYVAGAPAVFHLSGNYPNPFNATTRIQYSIPKNGPVSLKVYDLSGREVALLFDGPQSAGNHFVQFDGNGLASGVYLYRLQSGGMSVSKKFLLMK